MDVQLGFPNRRPRTVINILDLIDDAECFRKIRDLRWPDGVACPVCDSRNIRKNGHDDTQPCRQKYQCNDCGKRFDDLTDTIFAGHHQPLKVWVICLYFMGLNLSNEQIAKELNLNKDDVQKMTTQLREGVVVRKPKVELSGEVECDEAYVVAGHKGNPEAVKKKGRKGRRRRLKGQRGRGTKEKEKPPIFGMIQRGGQLVLRMLSNVQQMTIAPLMKGTIETNSTVYTDEYDIYDRLKLWGYEHQTVCHACGEFARDDDGDGFHEVHVNTIEGVWSILRSWLRPHRGISQEKLPFYVGFFEFVHNVRQRGKALLGSLLELFAK